MVAVTWTVGSGERSWSPPAFDTAPVRMWVLVIVCALALLGATLHVKSLIRERRDPRYALASKVMAVVSVPTSVTLAAWWGWPQGPWLVLPFLGLAARAFLVGGRSMWPGAIGMIVWVADEGADALTAIDAATSKIVTTVTGIGEPHNVHVAPDGARVYAVSGDGAAVVGIDTRTYRVTGSERTGPAPAHVVVTPRRDQVLRHQRRRRHRIVYRTGDLIATRVIQVSGGPHGARPTPDGREIIVANLSARTVEAIDTRTDTRTASIRVGGSPVQVAVSPDSRFAFVSARLGHQHVRRHRLRPRHGGQVRARHAGRRGQTQRDQLHKPGTRGAPAQVSVRLPPAPPASPEHDLPGMTADQQETMRGDEHGH